MRCRIAILAALALLTACGTASDSPILTLARASLEPDREDSIRPSIEAQQQAIARDVRLSGSTAPVLMVALPTGNAVASLVISGENAGAVTWLDASGVSVVTRRGVVVATRGLGTDVMASDVSGTLAALARGGSGYRRVQRFLDGEGHLQDRPLTCDATRAGGKVTETCRGGGETVTNIYEIRGGAAVRSRQWLGTEIGYAVITRLQ